MLDSTSQEFSSTRLPLLQMPITSSKLSPVFLIYQLKIHLSTSGLIICLNSSLNSGKHLFLFLVYCVKGCYKGYRWTARWSGIYNEVQKGPKQRSFCRCAVEVFHPPSTWMCQQPEYTPNPILWRSCRHDQLLTHFPAGLPSLENGGWVWKFQASNHGFIFLVTSLHPGTHQESPH